MSAGARRAPTECPDNAACLEKVEENKGNDGWCSTNDIDTDQPHI